MSQKKICSLIHKFLMGRGSKIQKIEPCSFWMNPKLGWRDVKNNFLNKGLSTNNIVLKSGF